MSVGQVIVVRDKGNEDQIAKLFETIRVDAKLPSLTRIGHRDSLEQQVCAIAHAGTLGNRRAWDRAAYYKTAQPQSISAELTRVASFKEQSEKNKLANPSYSVALAGERLQDRRTNLLGGSRTVLERSRRVCGLSFHG
jgi:hypothetical protein